jgi:polar amino acid transport system substrate-binding protein
VNDASAVVGQVANFPPNSLRIFPELLSKEPLAFAVRYDSQDLLEVLNLFFHNAALDGRLEQNLNYWVNTVDWKKDH